LHCPTLRQACHASARPASRRAVCQGGFLPCEVRGPEYYATIIFPALGTGFIITIESWLAAYRDQVAILGVTIVIAGVGISLFAGAILTTVLIHRYAGAAPLPAAASAPSARTA
jgi:hypothetical protein